VDYDSNVLPIELFRQKKKKGLQLRLPRYAVHIANVGVTYRSQLGSGVSQHS
jgi:hypothetical protein